VAFHLLLSIELHLAFLDLPTIATVL